MLTATGIYFVVIISTAPMGEETTLFPEAECKKSIYMLYLQFFYDKCLLYNDHLLDSSNVLKITDC